MRIMRTEGDKLLVKAVVVKIFQPGNKKSSTVVTKAPHGKLINHDGIFQVLGELVERVEKKWPDEEYKLVPLGPSTFNIVWLCKKVEAAAG